MLRDEGRVRGDATWLALGEAGSPSSQRPDALIAGRLAGQLTNARLAAAGLAVDAPIEVRYARARARGRDESAATLDEFRRKEELEMAGNETKQQLALCMAMADRTIVNDGTIEELRRKVEDLL